MTGPTIGTIGVASSNFTVTLDQPAAAGGILCIITDSVAQAEISHTPVLIPENQTTGVFWITAGTTGSRTITLAAATGNLNVTGQQITYTAAAAGTATSYTFTGPSTAPINATSLNFVLTPRTDPVFNSTTHVWDTDGTSSATIRVTDSRDSSYTDHTFSGASPSPALTFTVTVPSGTSNGTQFTLTPTCITSPSPFKEDPSPLTVTCLPYVPLNLGSITAYYSLDQASTYYRLTGSVTSTTLAFVVATHDVTLDLNGQTVIYDNATPIVVPDGGFEDSNLNAWNITGAPQAVLATARTGMWGAKMLHFPSITTNQTIISSQISIPNAGVPYTATITPRYNNSDSGSTPTTVLLTVKDATDGTILGSSDGLTGTVLNDSYKGDGTRGFSPYVTFTPTTNHNVVLQIDITVLATDTVDLDYAALMRTNIFGVANGSPASAAANFTIYGGNTSGSITQGQANSFRSHAINYNVDGTGDATSFLCDGVTVSWSGLDTHGIHCQYTNNIKVINSTFTGRNDRFSDRMTFNGAIHMSSYTGYVDIENNTMSGTMQLGSSSQPSGTQTSGYTIKHNVITHTSICTEGYGIGSNNGLYNFEIAYNTVDPVNGRGLFFDNIAINGLVHHNYCAAIEAPNLEYAYDGLEAVGLRIRPQPGPPYQDKTSWPMQNVTFEGNHFVGQTGEGLSWAADGAKLQIFAENSNVLFSNNVFRAVATAIDSNYGGTRPTTAWGLNIPDCAVNCGVTFVNNVFESNDVSLNFGDNESWLGPYDVLFINNEIRKSSDYTGVFTTHYGFGAGDFGYEANNIRFIDNSYTGGATTNFIFWDYDKTKSIFYGYLLTVTVTYNSNPVPGASVTITDNQSNQSSGGPYLTGPDGTVQVPGCVKKYSSDGTTGQNNTPVLTTFSSLLIAASYGSLSGSTTLSGGTFPTSDQSVTIVIS